MKLQTIQEKASRTLWAASALFIIGLTMTSCSEDEENAAAVGYLCPPAFEVDVTVENLDLSRSVSIEIEEEDIPAVSEITFKVTDANGKVKYNEPGLWTEPLILPVGPYKIEATYGENGFGAPYFTGETNGKIVALDKTESSIELTLQNAMVRVTLGPLEGHFIPTELSANDNELGAYEKEKWYYVPSGKMISLKLDGTSSAGVETSFTHDLSAKTAPSTAYDIVLEQPEGWPTISLPEQQDGAWATRLYITPATISGNISDANKEKIVYEVSTSKTDWSNPIKSECIEGDYHVVKGLTNGQTYYVRACIGNLVSDSEEIREVTIKENLNHTPITIVHTYDDNSGYLTGSTATIDLGLTEILKQYVTAGALIISSNLSKDSTPMRSLTSYTGATTMGVASDWTYLPQGSNYTLNVNHKLKGETAETTVLTKNLTVEKPIVNFTYSAQCSYDKYLMRDIDGANNCDAETIYITTSWTISDDILTNSNYSKSFTVTLDGGTPQNMTIDINKKDYAIGGELSWSSHTVLYSASFDGISLCNNTQTHHITGMPYRANPPTSTEWEAATEGHKKASVTWPNGSDNFVKLFPYTGLGSSGTKARITSKQAFSIPEGDGIYVNVINYCSCYGGLPYYSLKFGETNLLKESGDDEISYNKNTHFSKGSYNVVLQSSYGVANMTSFHKVTILEVLYGPYP